MQIGFSLSPGGLLLPYHLGALDALAYYKLLDETTPLAGSSAGAIAVASAACQIDVRQVLETTIAISDACEQMGGARGRLLPLLREQLNEKIGDAEMEVLQDRPGCVGLAYKEILPIYRPILQTNFRDRSDVINAVCNSSMFPFFATQWPCSLDTFNRIIPRLVVDGFFTVPRDRFGCPDFAMANDGESPVKVDRTVAICPFPQERIRLHAMGSEDCISPTAAEPGTGQMERLFRLATESSSREELTEVFDQGFADAEAWAKTQLAQGSTILN